MKKIIKMIMVFLILLSSMYIIYHFRDQIVNLLTNVNFELNGNLGLYNQQDYTDKEIQEMLESNQETIEGEYVGKIDDYYYGQLDIYSKIIYRSILDNTDELKNKTYEIKLSNVLSNAMQQENGKETINLAFQNAWNALRLDHPEIYYIDVENIYLTTKITTVGKKVTYEFYLSNKENENKLQQEFSTKESIDKSISEISVKKEEIVKELSNENDFAKILYIHNWIIENIDYDINMQNVNNNNIYGAIIEKQVVCEGYAKTFKYLLDELNIPCVIICGDVTDEKGITQKHAWNAVYTQGDWYAVDTTWDDPIIIGGGKLTNNLKYKYFLKGSIEIEKNHKQIGKLSDDNNEIEFKYPELSLENYKK